MSTQDSNDWNPDEYYNVSSPENQEPAVPVVAIPQAEAPGNRALYIALGTAAILLLAVVGVIAGMFLASQNSVANDTSSTDVGSSGSLKMPAPVPPVDSTGTADSTSPTDFGNVDESPSGAASIFSGSNLQGFEDQLDEMGWKDSSARCEAGKYARIVAVADAGKVVVCESHQGERTFVGELPEEASSSESVPVKEFGTQRIVAENDSTTYTLTPTQLEVTKNGAQVAAYDITAYGTLNAG